MMTDEEEERFRATLQDAVSAIGVPLSSDARERCLRYTRRLLQVNQQMNLTRITSPDAIAIKHFADSLSIFAVIPDLKANALVADVGTGAGFPGMVLKIARPDLTLTLLDSLSKRLTFLTEVARELDLTGIRTVHTRAEDAGRNLQFRDRFDLVTARAVASLPTLIEWCVPLVRVNGYFVAMKGNNVGTELESATVASDQLGIKLIEDRSILLPAVEADPEPSQRHLLLYRKIRPTHARYPRSTAEIKNQPL